MLLQLNKGRTEITVFGAREERLKVSYVEKYNRRQKPRCNHGLTPEFQLPH